MSSALDGVPAGVLALSGDLRIVAANRGMVELVGRGADELIGQTLDVVLSAPSRILFQTHVYPALEGDGRVEEMFLGLVTASNEAVPVLLNATRRSGEEADTDGGEVAYDAAFVRIRARARWEADLLATTRALEAERTASQRLARELAAAATDLEARYAEEQRNREFRDAFVGVISHELRTPVTTIFAMTHLLRRRSASLDASELEAELGEIEGEADRLRRLTEDLLVLSRAEAGRLVVADDPIVVRHAVHRAVAGEQARSPRHEIAVGVDGGLPPVRGEELYLEQIVRNFVSNAVKYGPQGERIDVRVAQEGAGVAIRVIDAGPGLPPGDPDRLFDLFHRSPEAVAQTSGAGIGLFICRELAHAMGGRVWAAPAEPAAPADPAAAAPTGAEFGLWLPALSDEEAIDGD